MLGPSDSSSSNVIVAVYDHFLEKWQFISVDEYIARFGAIVAVPQKDLTELELSCIDTLRKGFSLADITQNKEEKNNVFHDKEEKLSEDRDKLEEDVSEEKEGESVEENVAEEKMEGDKVEENFTEEKDGDKVEGNVAEEKKAADKVEENVTEEKDGNKVEKNVSSVEKKEGEKVEDNVSEEKKEGDKVEEDVSEEKKEGDKAEENVAEEKNEKELKVYVRRSKMKPEVKAVQFGEIELQVSLKKSGKVTINPTRSAPSSSANPEDGTVNKEPDELPLARVLGDGQGSHGGHDQKKGKKRKKNKKQE